MSIYDISDFMALGGQPVPVDVDETLTTEQLMKFVLRIEDELDETYDAIGYFDDDWGFYIEQNEMPPRDVVETVDGFLDIAYTALSAAIRVAGPNKTILCWREVLESNLSKVDGTYGPVVRDPETGKIEKPEGWEAPCIGEILGVTE